MLKLWTVFKALDHRSLGVSSGNLYSLALGFLSYPPVFELFRGVVWFNPLDSPRHPIGIISFNLSYICFSEEVVFSYLRHSLLDLLDLHRLFEGGA